MNQEARNKEIKTYKGFTAKQIFWLVFGILVSINAIIFLVLGLITDYANLPGDILEAPDASMKAMMGGVGFTWFGVITFIVGTFIYSLALSFSSKSADREKEREARREQRLKAMEEENKGIVVDYTSSSAVK